MRSGDSQGARQWLLKALDRDAADLRALRAYVRLSDMSNAHDAGDVDDLFASAREVTSGRVGVGICTGFYSCFGYVYTVKDDSTGSMA